MAEKGGKANTASPVQAPISWPEKSTKIGRRRWTGVTESDCAGMVQLRQLHVGNENWSLEDGHW